MSVPRSTLIPLLFGLVLLCASVPPLQAQSFIELPEEAAAAEEAGQYEKAGRLYERAYTIFGGEPESLYRAAKSYAQAGLHDRAFQNLERVVASGWTRVDEMKWDSALTLLHEDERWGELVAEAEARYAAFDLDLRQELLAMEEQDQEVRANFNDIIARQGTPEADSALARMAAVDERLGARIKAIISEHGWPERSLVGDDGASAAWLIVQHADTAYMRKVLPLLLDAAERGEAREGEAALLHDRVLMGQRKPQLYGTQLYSEPGEEQLKLHPIKDEANVDERRAEVKLPPLAEYLAFQGIEYVPPAEREN